MADKNVSIDIIAADRTRAAFESVKRGLGEVDGKLSMVKGTIGAFSALAASAGLTQLVTEAVQAAAKAEQSSNRLDAVLKATGNTTGYTREQLDGFADSLAKATTFDDEGIRDAMSALTKFGSLHGETFQRALRLSADYAAFTGGEMADAAQAIGKAFADPINGGAMLERQLGKLTDAQDASIKKFMEQGDIMSAQQVWAEKLEKAIGGTAGAMNTGITGATTAAKKSWDELMESMGKSGASKLVVENSLLSISALLDAVKQKMEAVNKETQRMIEGRSGKLQPLEPELGGQKGFGDLKPGTTVAEIKAAGDAIRAQQDEQERLREAAAAKREEEFAKARAKVQEEASATIYKRWQDQMRAHLKAREDMRKKEIEEAAQMGAELRGLYEADVQRRIDLEIQSGEEMKALRERDMEQKLAAYNDLSQRIWDGMRTDQEMLLAKYKGDEEMLNASLSQQYFTQLQYDQLMFRLKYKYEKDKTALEDEEYRKRFGIATRYRAIDLGSAGFFFDQMSGLMQTKSRTLFEIGKAGAIAGAVIDTYKAATGAYAALASIPFVGPALGAAAAAAAVAIGMARVQAIKSTSFGGGGAAGTGVFAANPSTGLPESPTSAFDAPQNPIAQSQSTRRMLNLNIQFVGSGRYSQEEIRDSLVPALKEAFGDGLAVL